MSGESFCIIDTQNNRNSTKHLYKPFISKPDFIKYYMLYPKYVIFSNSGLRGLSNRQGPIFICLY